MSESVPAADYVRYLEVELQAARQAAESARSAAAAAGVHNAALTTEVEDLRSEVRGLRLALDLLREQAQHSR